MVLIRIGVVVGLALLPLAWTAWDMAQHGLGANPAERVEHFTGDWALNLLLLTLLVRPLWRTLRWRSSFVWLRRTLGLLAFFYATLHLLAFVVFELNLSLGALPEQVVEKPYVALGMAAWLLLVPLAITSTAGWQRRLGRRWNTLHRLVYAATLLGIAHYWWLVKKDITAPAMYLLAFALLMGWRLWLRSHHRRH